MMPFGLSEETIRKIRDLFARHPAVEKAVLYGSRAKGTCKPGSDIDLTLYGEGLSRKEMDLIQNELEESDLPYSIDLSEFSRLTQTDLRDHIERVGVVFYLRQPGD